MNRYTKITYFIFLALISVVQLLQGNYLLALVLAIITGIALPLFEKREAKRQFYRAIRKLYVCVDLDAFIIERENLVKYALIKSAVATPLNLLTGIEGYYNGQRETVARALSSMPPNVDYQFWIDSYIGLCDASQIEEVQLGSHLDKVPRYYREIAVQRLEVLTLLRKLYKEGASNTSEIEALRERVTFNLLVAELTQCLMVRAQNERIRKYYEQAVLNICKGLSI